MQDEIYELVEVLLSGIRSSETLLLYDLEKCAKSVKKRGWQAMFLENSDQMIRDTSWLLGF